MSVAYAAPDAVHVIELKIGEGATIEDVIRASGILQRCPEVELRTAAVGVFNRERDLSWRVCDGDRVEIYRPLSADPRDARRRRAAARRREQ